MKTKIALGRGWQSAARLFLTLFVGLTMTKGMATCVSAPSGMVGWWRGESNGFDAAGGNHGQVQGGTTFAAGRVGQAFLFNGNGSAVLLGSPSALQLQNFTIEAWIKRSSATAASLNNGLGYGCIISYNNNGYTLFMNGAGALCLSKTGTDFVASSALVADTNYHHIAVTTQSGTVVFYIDGVAYPAPNYSRVYDFATPVSIGGIGNTYTFNGAIDELAVYNRALSASEIQSIYNANTDGKCLEPASILTHPTNYTAVAGTTAAFSVVASGSHPLTYQWQLEGTNLFGATNRVLTLPGVQFHQAGLYSVQVSNAIGSAFSSNAVLTVTPPPPCSAPASNLVSWWRGEGDVLDAVSGNHGTNSAGTVFAGAKAGQGFVFDGNGASIRLGNPASLRLQDFTIEGWIRRSSASVATLNTSSGIGCIMSYNDNGYCLFMRNDGSICLARTADVEFVPSSATITDTNFHHVAVSKVGTNVVFYIDGVAYPTPGYNRVFSFTTTLSIGGINNTYSFYGAVDELAVYSRALSGTEIQSIYNASMSGKCTDAVSPFIVGQPINQTVQTGSSASFTVAVGGSAPLSYQWSFNGTNLYGATSSTLSLTNVQFAQAGNYAVVATNVAGSVTSSNATLVVNFPPARVSVVSNNVAAGGTVIVSVNLAANGNESALGFSVGFDSSRLSFASVSLGAGAASAFLLANTNQLPNGRLGVALALSSGTFAPGTQTVVNVSFVAAVVPNQVQTTISLIDQPVARQLSDELANPLPGTYHNGVVSIAGAQYEADISPRPNGNQSVTITDWVLAGRFVAGLEIATNISEFQRVDSAPRTNRGNGTLSITDWVQAGRYAAGLDPLTPAGGPTEEITNAPISLITRSGNDRILRVLDSSILAGQTTVVTVQLAALGNENAAGFSLGFDPTALTFQSAVLSPQASNATIHLNTTQLGAGKLGVALALPIGSSFSSNTLGLVNVTFAVSAAARGRSTISLVGSPVVREVSDPSANPLATTYLNGELAIEAIRPVLRIASTTNQVVLSWSAVAPDFVLQFSPATPLATWSNVLATPVVNGTDRTVVLPRPSESQFFRLLRP